MEENLANRNRNAPLKRPISALLFTGRTFKIGNVIYARFGRHDAPAGRGNPAGRPGLASVLPLPFRTDDDGPYGRQRE